MICKICNEECPDEILEDGICQSCMASILHSDLPPNIEDIWWQSRHADLEVILGYIQLIPEAKRKAYEKGMALGQENEKNIPQLTIKPEVQLTPQQPTIDNIKNKETELKVKQLELELANKQAEIELLRLRQQMNKTDNTNIYGW